ncbi:ATP synthase subunit I [Acidovorax temperans]|uniref:ATP synthase subunit I n=1 Tax=Acidovorax temperans TaxID=80878 RepID=UPI001A94AD08|nr:ATP synthase subunit I [Acidovorax temperans]MBO0941132.1 ATP synthase subunit I [Acidovorax temperans]WCT24124.1 ATP synthase subunit I [Acidovorax temperans]
MKTIAPETETEAEDSDFKPLTAQEAEQWRRRNPPVSPWKVVLGQSLVGVVVALIAWMWTQDVRAGWSAAYGSLAVVVPAALFAYGVLRQKSAPRPGLVMLGFAGWEAAKIVLTIALLAAAPRVVPGLNWLALVAGLVITMKTYWVALMVRPGVRKTD